MVSVWMPVPSDAQPDGSLPGTAPADGESGASWWKPDRGRPPSIGTPGGIRTHDRRLRRPLLCPLSYGGVGAPRARCKFPIASRGGRRTAVNQALSSGNGPRAS